MTTNYKIENRFIYSVLNQPILVDKYVDFRLEVLKNWIKNPYVTYVVIIIILQMMDFSI